MSEPTGPAVDAAPGPLDYAPPATTQEPLSLDEAFARYSKPQKAETQAVEGADDLAPPPNEPAKAASEPEEAPAEVTEETDPEQPAIDPPRSWTKEAKETWKALPRDTQEYIAQRESERDKGLARSQNELAEQRKAMEAERQAIAKARTDYEAKLPALMQALHDVNAGQFGDIKTIDDVSKLASEDPFRYLQWQAHQQKMAAVNAEVERGNKTREAESLNKRNSYMAEQNQKLRELVSEPDDGKFNTLLKASADALLSDRGFSRDQIMQWANSDIGGEILNDARVQKLIIDGYKYQELQKAPLKAVSKPVPPVIRPGTSQGVAARANAAKATSIQALSQKLNDSGSVDDAMALLRARRASR